ncbi:MFS transporter [Pseudomonas sp. Fig-3]|uniref:MFS transporter n=1 Tax=unclassified Pseudomonas TaxID=196821 RepID=UPI0010DE5E74|nr:MULTISPECIES: MFS transporter [unclassified Pseudomonas]TNB81499.1 MFS transporter [Pseudomonas sp. Fig-3]VII91615.1 Transport protein [Pseudomonas sp. FG-3G]
MRLALTARPAGLRGLLLCLIGPVAIIAIAQLFGTSLWFSANGAADSLMSTWHASAADIGWLTNAVQLGFILGTLSLSLSGAADRFQASTLFVYSSIAGGLFNLGFAWLADGLFSGAVLRFCVGVTLAGIYPMGMKLIVGWAPERTGLALAQLVAMLTLGTALPHGLRLVGANLPWQVIITASSVLALAGAMLIGVLGDGPHARSGAAGAPTKRGGGILEAFRIHRFRAAALGYFGHMWELYAFWTVVPLIVSRTSLASAYPAAGVAGLSFGVMAIGALGSLIGGLLSQRMGSARVALGSLGLSGLCGLLFVLVASALPAWALLLLLAVWGASVVADSPQFSALAAKACPRDAVGSALAIQNSIGFAITVVSIAGTTWLFERVGIDALWLLVPGPVLGLAGYLLSYRSADT